MTNLSNNCVLMLSFWCQLYFQGYHYILGISTWTNNSQRLSGYFTLLWREFFRPSCRRILLILLWNDRLRGRKVRKGTQRGLLRIRKVFISYFLLFRVLGRWWNNQLSLTMWEIQLSRPILFSASHWVSWRMWYSD